MTTFYRISQKKFAKDEMMKGRGKRPLDARLEALLEQYRPPDCPDRGDCVYMRAEREFSTLGITYDEGYVHIVEPIGEVYKRDLAWIGAIQRRHNVSRHLLKDQYPMVSDAELAERYWRGEASTNPSWEWVAKEAKVVDVECAPSRVRRNTPFLDTFSNKPRPE